MSGAQSSSVECDVTESIVWTGAIHLESDVIAPSPLPLHPPLLNQQPCPLPQAIMPNQQAGYDTGAGDCCAQSSEQEGTGLSSPDSLLLNNDGQEALVVKGRFTLSKPLPPPPPPLPPPTTQQQQPLSRTSSIASSSFNDVAATTNHSVLSVATTCLDSSHVSNTENDSPPFIIPAVSAAPGQRKLGRFTVVLQEPPSAAATTTAILGHSTPEKGNSFASAADQTMNSSSLAVSSSSPGSSQSAMILPPTAVHAAATHAAAVTTTNTTTTTTPTAVAGGSSGSVPLVMKKGRFVVSSVGGGGGFHDHQSSASNSVLSITIPDAHLHTGGHEQQRELTTTTTTTADSESAAVFAVSSLPDSSSITSSPKPTRQSEFPSSSAMVVGTASSNVPIIDTTDPNGCNTYHVPDVESSQKPCQQSSKPVAASVTTRNTTTTTNNSTTTSLHIAGLQGVGKLYHYLDQIRIEAIDVDRTMKKLLHEARILREKNRELEMKAMDYERKLCEERSLREQAEALLKLEQQKLRAVSVCDNNNTKNNELFVTTQEPPPRIRSASATTSFDSNGITASMLLLGDYRDEKSSTIEQRQAGDHASAAPVPRFVQDSGPPTSPLFPRSSDFVDTFPTHEIVPVVGESYNPGDIPGNCVVNKDISIPNVCIETTERSKGASPRNLKQQGPAMTSRIPPIHSTAISTINSCPNPTLHSANSLGRAPNARPPLNASSMTLSHLSATTTVEKNDFFGPSTRSLASDFDPLRPASRDEPYTGDSLNESPIILSMSVSSDASSDVFNKLNSLSPSRGLHSYSASREVQQQHHPLSLQQPSLDVNLSLSTSTSFTDFQKMLISTQQASCGPSSTGHSTLFVNGSQQRIDAITASQSLAPIQSVSTFVDPFDEIIQRKSTNNG